MFKRIFDLLFSFTGIILFLIPGLVIALFIVTGSKGGVFYRQRRVGKNGIIFRIFKFRTMHTGSDKKGLLTVGSRDPRITRIGHFLRKSKLDEMPQLLNVFIGEMSFVGPRPEVEKYVAMYNEEQREVLKVKPGITDAASIRYIDENAVLAQYENPEKAYINFIMPEKLRMNIEYVRKRTLWGDIRLILKTFAKIFR